MYLYSSESNDAPKLTNTWGDFNKIINYVLDGGTPHNVLSIEAIGGNKCVIKFDSEIPYRPYQTIEIKNATNTIYNDRFFIEKLDIQTNEVTCYSKNISDILTKEENINLRSNIIPCGMQKMFGGVDDNRTVFKTTNNICFRIDDRDFRPLVTPAAPINATTNNWQKIARICMADSFDSLDSSSARLFPYTPERPTENFQPTGKYIGQTFIVYNRAFNNNTSSYNDYIVLSNVNLRSNNIKWNIYANEKVMYIYFTVNATATNDNRQCIACYVIGEYNSSNPSAKNGIMVTNKFNTLNDAYDITSGYNTSLGTPSFAYNNNPTFPSNVYNTTNSNAIAVIYDNLSNNIENVIFNREFIMGGAISGISNMQYPNPYDNGIYISDIVVGAGTTTYYGKCYNLKHICNGVAPDSNIGTEKILNGSLVVIDNKYYIAQKLSNSYYSSSYDAGGGLVLIEMDR